MTSFSNGSCVHIWRDNGTTNAQCNCVQSHHLHERGNESEFYVSLHMSSSTFSARSPRRYYVYSRSWPTRSTRKLQTFLVSDPRCEMLLRQITAILDKGPKLMLTNSVFM